jgi:TPR repeat protein
MFGNGLGVVQNYAEAMKWYRRAAKQGHAAAQYHQHKGGQDGDQGAHQLLWKGTRRQGADADVPAEEGQAKEGAWELFTG